MSEEMLRIERKKVSKKNKNRKCMGKKNQSVKWFKRNKLVIQNKKREEERYERE